MSGLVITSDPTTRNGRHRAANQTTVAPPDSIRLRRALGEVEVRWPDGLHSRIPALVLRKHCACSACTQAERRGVLTLIDADLGIDDLTVTGVSGVQFVFSDGHDRGLYPWAYLRQLSEQASQPFPPDSSD